MEDIWDVSTLEVSEYITCFRRLLLRQNFFEHSIYNAVPYKVQHTTSFQLPHHLFLRYGTEPDVWLAGEKYNKFFFIGSLFRNERQRTKFHRYEFKLVDFYIRCGSMKTVVDQFLRLLHAAELRFNLPCLSKSKVVTIPYEKFHEGKEIRGEGSWVVVTGYPVSESFYDVRDGKRTKKFEIFFRTSKGLLEIASAGTVGQNLNEQMRIKNDTRFTNKKVFSKKFIGLGLGIERLIYLYHTNA